MAARAQYGKQRQALRQHRRLLQLKYSAQKTDETHLIQLKNDRIIIAICFTKQSSSIDRKTSKRNGLTKVYGTLPKAQPPSRAPSLL